MTTKETIQKAYLTLQENCEIKIGDRVKISRKATSEESGWGDTWTDGMDQFVGQEGVVKRVAFHPSAGFCVNFPDGSYNFPFFILERLEKSPVSFSGLGREYTVNKGGVKGSDGLRYSHESLIRHCELMAQKVKDWLSK